MTQATSDKNRTEFMTDLWAEVAAVDAALDIQIAAIMARKPARPHKVEPELNWLVSKARPGKKNSESLSAGPRKLQKRS